MLQSSSFGIQPGYEYKIGIKTKCNCLSPIPKWFAPDANKENTGLNIDALKLCSDSMAGLDCLLKYLLSGTFSVLGADDRHCMDPCFEPTYKSFMYAKNKLTEIYLRNLNIPLFIRILEILRRESL
uniref:Uncharacterized protein n=1 Tax=Romanomermis culicivorax TaxID=13658 RepID=A0A915I0P1_ROMCU